MAGVMKHEFQHAIEHLNGKRNGSPMGKIYNDMLYTRDMFRERYESHFGAGLYEIDELGNVFNLENKTNYLKIKHEQ